MSTAIILPRSQSPTVQHSLRLPDPTISWSETGYMSRGDTWKGPGVDNIEQYDCEMLWTCGCVRVYFDPDEGGFYHIERHLEATHVVVGPLALAPPIAVFAEGVQPVRTTATKLRRDEPLLVLSKCTHGICAIQVPVTEGPSDLVFADLVNALSPSPRKRNRGSVAHSSPHPDDKQASPIAGPSSASAHSVAAPRATARKKHPLTQSLPVAPAGTARTKGKGKGKAVCVAPPIPPVDEPAQEKLPPRASPPSSKDCEPFVCGIDACTEDFSSEQAWEAHMKAKHGLHGGNWVEGAPCDHDECKKKNPPTHFKAWNTFVRRHRSAHREPRESPIIRPECGLVFSWHDPLWRHIENQHEPKSEELYNELGKRPRTKGKSTAPTKSKSKAPTKSRVATQTETRSTRTAVAPVAGPSRTRRRKDSTDENAYGEDEDQEEAPEDSGSEWEERPKKKKKLSASPYSCPALSRGHQFAEVYAKVYENGVGAKPRKSRWRSSSL
ncbi:hypothetical protein K466DRAFT_656189 [Polyporus arcularius HHB13444]|uniref:C2H2-type domain-containing protein n=1 Tax=Polyporus arcularius HHB13444 TaxID=1314778 RepID=A0A5C3NVP8_9APHY|nr:hypothetical protein K466DRAFT_656189 [Polyporus arcularius HHB13444]